MKRIFRVAWKLVAALLVLVVILVALLHTSWGKSFVRRKIEAKLAQSVNGSVVVTSLDYGFLFGHVELGDIIITDRLGNPAVAIGSIHVAVDRGSLLHGKPVIDDLEIDRVSVTVVQTADGHTNLEGLFKPSGEPPPAFIRVGKLHVGGSATMARADGTRITVTDLLIDGVVSAEPPSKTVDATLSTVAARVTIDKPGAAQKTLALAIHSVTVAQRGGAITATIEQLGLGALTVEKIEAKLGLVDGVLAGNQDIKISNGRIARDKLSTLLGKQVLVDDVSFAASLAGPASALVMHGNVATRNTTLTLDGTANLGEPAHPSYDMTLVGKGASEDIIAGGPLGVPPILTDVKVTVAGSGIVPPDLDAKVTLAVGATHIGAVDVDSVSAVGVAHHGGFTLDHFDAKGLGFTIAASGDIASDTTLHGQVTVVGSTTEAIKVLRAAGLAVWNRVPPLPKIAVTVKAAGKLEGELSLEVEPMELVVAGGRVKMSGTAVLDHRVVRDAKTTIELSHLDIGSIARLANKPAPKIAGSVSGTLGLTRNALEQRAAYDLAVALRAPAVIAQIHGDADLSVADVKAKIVRVSDKATLATVIAHVGHDDKGLLPNAAWHVVIDAPTRALAELVALAPPNPKLDQIMTDLAGDATLHAELFGTPNQPRGSLDATIHAETPMGPQTVGVHSEITSANGIAIATTAHVGDLVTIASMAHLPTPFVGGQLAIERLKRGLTANATIEMSEHDLATLPLIKPELARLGGRVGGSFAIAGLPNAPKLAGTLTWHDYALASGGVGTTKLSLAGTPEKAALEIRMADANTHVLTIAADVVKTGDHLAVVAKMHADPMPVVTLVPAAIAPDLHGADPGTLTWDMTANLALVLHGKTIGLEDANVDGTLAIHGGSFALPHTKRKWHDLELVLTGDPHGIRLDRLTARESDVKERSLAVSGLVTIEKQKHDDGTISLVPKQGELSVSLVDWLALGTGSPLFSDAPIAEVTLDANAKADLAAPVLAIDATITKGDVRIPDRLDRSHQPEKPSVSGDVIFVDDAHRVGALPVPPPVVEAHHPLPIDVSIHVPQPIHVLKSPLDLQARGELTVQVRDTGVATRGTLTATGGELVLFGREHAVVDGSLSFTDAHPHGEFALRFARPLPPEVMRQLSITDPARVTLTGPPTKPVVALGGAFNSDLDEVLSIYHAGHPVFYAPPGIYPSSTAEVPHGDQFLIFGFLASALPQYLFLDDIQAWADPSEPRGQYGEVRNLEADRYAADGSGRVRVVGRPTEPGRSTAELQLDHLWLDTGRALVGAGLRAGDRIGGGLALFFEWSSAH